MATDIGTEEERGCLERLDGYANARHSCFVSELFPRREADTYFVCFRPLGGSPRDSNRYECEYIEFAPVEMRALGSGCSLTVAIAEKLDKALPRLRR
jgi:hypothetical protein